MRVRAAQRGAPQHVRRPTGREEYANSPVTFSVPSGRSGARRRRPPAASSSRRSRWRRRCGRHRAAARLSSRRAAAARRGPARLVDGRAARSRSTTGAAVDQQQLQRRRRRRAPARRPGRRCRVRRASSSRHSAMSASLPGLQRADLVRRGPRHARRRRSWPARAPRGTVSAGGPPRSARRTAARARSSSTSWPASLEAAPSTPEPDRRAGVAAGRATRRDAGAEPGVGATGSAPRRCRWRRSAAIAASSRWTQCASQTSSPSQPRPLDVLHRRAAEALAAERLLVERLGEVGVQPHAARAGPARPPRASARAVTENGEHGATRDPQHRAGRRVVVAVDRGLGRGEDRVVGPRPRRPAAARPATGPRSIEPRVGWKRRPTSRGRVDLGAEQVAAVAREDVVVVGAWSCSRSSASQASAAAAAATHDLARRCRAQTGYSSVSQLEQGRVLRRARGWPTGRGGGGC